MVLHDVGCFGSSESSECPCQKQRKAPEANGKNPWRIERQESMVFVWLVFLELLKVDVLFLAFLKDLLEGLFFFVGV